MTSSISKKKLASMASYALILAAGLALAQPACARADGSAAVYADAQARPSFGRGTSNFGATRNFGGTATTGAAFNNGHLDPNYDWQPPIKVQHVYVGLFTILFKGTTEIPVQDYFAQGTGSGAAGSGASGGISSFGGSNSGGAGSFGSAAGSGAGVLF